MVITMNEMFSYIIAKNTAIIEQLTFNSALKTTKDTVTERLAEL